MLLTEKQIETFHIEGYVKAGKVLEDAEIDRLNEELHLVLEGKKAHKPVVSRNLLEGRTEYGDGRETKQTVHQIVNIWESSPAYLEHARNPELTETVSRLCNNTEVLRVWHDQIQYKPPRIGGPTNWHQDHPAWPVILPADLISAWVALDDVDPENGCMWMVPGSHRWGSVPLGTTPDFDPEYDPELIPAGVEVKKKPLIMKRGQVAFHHCMTWHGSNLNTSDRHRRAIAVHYMPGYILYKPTGTHLMEPHIHVQPGDVLAGDHFPVVYERSRKCA